MHIGSLYALRLVVRIRLPDANIDDWSFKLLRLNILVFDDTHRFSVARSLYIHFVAVWLTGVSPQGKIVREWDWVFPVRKRYLTKGIILFLKRPADNII